MRFVMGRPFTEAEALARFDKALKTNEDYPQVGWYCVSDKKNQNFVGIAKLVFVEMGLAEVGYGMMPIHWGKKLGTEMLQTLVDYAQTIAEINELLAIVHPDNVASKKILANQNFTLISSGFEDSRPAEYYRLPISGKP